MNASDRRRFSIGSAALLALALSWAESVVANPLMDPLLSIPREIPWLGHVGIYPGVLIRDIDQDGVRELLVANATGKSVDVYRVKNGEPRLTDSIKFPDVPVSMAAADIDLDGTPELVVGTLTEGAGGFVRVGTYRSGTFTQQWKSRRLDSIRFATEIGIGNVDLASKGKEIVVGLSYYQRGWMVFGPSGQRYQALFSESIGSDVDSLKVADVTGDEHADVILGTKCWSDYAIRLYQNYALTARLHTGGITYVATFDPDQNGKNQIIAGIGTTCGNQSRHPAPVVGLYEYRNGALKEKARTGPLTDLKSINVIVAGGRMKGIPVVAAATLNILPGARDAHYVRLFDRNLCELWRYRLDSKEVTFALTIGDVDNDGGNELVAATNKRIVAFKPRTAPWPSCQPSGGSPAGNADARQ